MKKYIIAFIHDGIGQTNLAEALSAEQAEVIFKEKKPDVEICRVREATESEIQKPGIPVIKNWVSTDDDNCQYCRQVDQYIYELVEMHHHINGMCTVSEPRFVDIRDYINENGSYTDDLEGIVELYYESVESFKGYYPDKAEQYQLLAEMIYETELSEPMEQFGFISEEDARYMLAQYITHGGQLQAS